MNDFKALKNLSGEQYLAIEDQLLSSEMTRSFLRMRDRRAAVLAVDEYLAGLRSIKEWIESANQRSSEDIHLEVLRKELIEMASSIRKAKSEIWAMKPADEESGAASTRRINVATEELDHIVHSTERATTDILNSAERIMEIARKVTEGGLTQEAEAIDGEATNILMACGFQDLTGQRIAKVVSTLRYLEERVDAMVRIWGVDGVRPDDVTTNFRDTRPDAALMHGPSDNGVDQSAVDAMFAEAVVPEIKPEEPAPKPEPVKAAAPPEVKPPKPAPVLPNSGPLDQSSIDSLFP